MVFVMSSVCIVCCVSYGVSCVLKNVDGMVLCMMSLFGVGVSLGMIVLFG